MLYWTSILCTAGRMVACRTFPLDDPSFVVPRCFHLASLLSPPSRSNKIAGWHVAMRKGGGASLRWDLGCMERMDTQHVGLITRFVSSPSDGSATSRLPCCSFASLGTSCHVGVCHSFLAHFIDDRIHRTLLAFTPRIKARTDLRVPTASYQVSVLFCAACRSYYPVPSTQVLYTVYVAVQASAAHQFPRRIFPIGTAWNMASLHHVNAEPADVIIRKLQPPTPMSIWAHVRDEHAVLFFYRKKTRASILPSLRAHECRSWCHALYSSIR
ncbi:hypothetical protein B0T18DRAFT_7327 [Schizothecium vesticola]|uniref:Uncharacterized protein n=1 Tax=Schizothecium vesticola TaxID=314040 RepID=A0AA40F8F8_9PEZI|nr:hypothetical protein B0T18DRAFT_7327 [Schizothecium vesticola]